MDNITDGSNKSNFELLEELLSPEGFRRVCRALEHAIGTAEASLYAELLGRGKYFAKLNQLDDEGYFFNTVIDLQQGTALSDFQQRRAIKQLQELGLISVKLKDSPPKRYFRISKDAQTLISCLQKGREVMQDLENEKQKQKQRIEEERLNKQGYFKSEETKDFKSEETKDLNLKKLQTKKNNANKNKREEEEPASTLINSETNQTLNIYLNGVSDKIGGEVKTTNKQNIKALSRLVTICGEAEAGELLKLWFDKADQGTANKGWPVGFLINQLSEYQAKLKEYRKEEQQRAAQAERQRLQDEEERQEEEARRKEEARRAALTSEQRRLEDIASRRLRVNMILELRQNSTDQGHETAEKIKSCLAELADLAAEEAQLLPQVKEA